MQVEPRKVNNLEAAKRLIEPLVWSGEFLGPEFCWEDGDRTLRAIMHMLECLDMCYQLTTNEVRVYEESAARH